MPEITRNDVIDALLAHYSEIGINKSIEYSFGFFDAMGVIRDLYVHSDNKSTIIMSRQDKCPESKCPERRL